MLTPPRALRAVACSALAETRCQFCGFARKSAIRSESDRCTAVRGTDTVFVGTGGGSPPGGGSGSGGREFLVDFNDAGPTPVSNWNRIDDGGLGTTTLIDSGGVSTSITLEITDSFKDSTNGTNGGGWTDPTKPWIVADALKDYLFLKEGDDTTGEIEIQGLDDGMNYLVELVSTRASSGNNRLGDFTVNGAHSDDLNSLGFDAFADGDVNHDTMVWSAVGPVGGKIVINVDSSPNPSGGFTYLNALRIVEPSGGSGRAGSTPEPASATMLVVGLCCCLLRSRSTVER